MRPFHKYLVRAKVEPKEQALEAVIMKQHDKGTLSLLWRLRKQKKQFPTYRTGLNTNRSSTAANHGPFGILFGTKCAVSYFWRLAETRLSARRLRGTEGGLRDPPNGDAATEDSHSASTQGTFLRASQRQWSDCSRCLRPIA